MQSTTKTQEWTSRKDLQTTAYKPSSTARENTRYGASVHESKPKSDATQIMSTIEYETTPSDEELESLADISADNDKERQHIEDLLNASTCRLLAQESARSIKQRVPWDRGYFRRFMQLSHILSLSNALSFPYYCARYGGLAFIIAYLCAYIFVGIPLLCAEMALGQFSSVPPIMLFRKMSPSLAGLGVAMLAILTFKSIVISANSTQSFLSALLTFIEGIQGPSWQNCGFHGAHPKLCYRHDYVHCNELWKNGSLSTHEFNKKCSGWVQGFSLIYNASNHAQWQFWRPPHLDYMSAHVYKPIYHQKEWSLNAGAVLLLTLIWIIKGVLSYVRVRKLGKYFVYMKAAIFVGMLVNLGLSIAFEPNGNDWASFFDTDLSSLGRLDIWAQATAHVMVSMNLGSGAVHKISSLSDFNENFLYNALLTSALDIFFSFLIGFVFLSSVSSVAHRIYPGDLTKHRLRFIFTHGFILTQTMFPEHMVWSKSFGWVFATFFYIKMAILGIPSSIVSLSMVKEALEEMILYFAPTAKWTNKENVLQMVSTCALATLGLLISVILVGSHGFMLSKLWREFCGVSLLLICLCELLSLNWHYGFKRYLANVKTMLTREGGRGQFFVYKLTTIVYKLITPLLITMALTFKCYKNELTRVLGYIFPLHFELFGWSIVVLTFIFIFAPCIRYVLMFWIRTGSLAHIFEPMPNWGPINEEDFTENMKNERVICVRNSF